MGLLSSRILRPLLIPKLTIKFCQRLGVVLDVLLKKGMGCASNFVTEAKSCPLHATANGCLALAGLIGVVYFRGRATGATGGEAQGCRLLWRKACHRGTHCFPSHS